MTNKDIIDRLLKETEELRNGVYAEIDYCKEHNYNLEAMALSYKNKAYSQVRDLLFRIEREIKED